MNPFQLKRLAGFAFSWVVLLFWVALAPMVRAADPAFVGILALAVDQSVAQKLGLSDEVRSKLTELVNRREEEAEQFVLRIKDFPAETRDRLMSTFAAESEHQGLALLSEEQKQMLRQIRIARAGMVTLGEPEVAGQLNLTAQQKQQINSLLEQRKADLTKGGEAQRRVTQAQYEKKLLDVLTGPQQYTWRVLAGLAEPGGAPSPAPPAAEAAPAGEGQAPTGETEVAKPAEPPAGDGKLRFNFQYADWKRVLEWFAHEADLSLQMDAPPPGTFNYTDNRAYSVAEALDLINGVLQFRGYTLVRNRRMLVLVNLEDGAGIPPALIETVTPEELDNRGKYEQLKCLFPLGTMTPEDVERELRPLVPDPNAMKVMPTSRQVLIQETGGNLRMIRAVIQAAESSAGGESIKEHTLRFVSGEDVMAVARPLLGMDEEAMSTPDGTLKVSFEPLGQRVFYSGTADMVARFNQIIEMVDVDPGVVEGGPPPEQLQLETHAVRADPTTVLEVLQTIFAGQEGVRLATDPVTGNIIALARPSQHKTMEAIIDQMERDAVQFEVIQLRRYDPQSMVLMLTKLLGKDSEEGGKGPTFDGNPNTMQLVVRGTAGEIEQIKQIVEKMDPPLRTDGSDDRASARLIPLTGRQLQEILDTAELLWPTTKRKNRIRVVMPSQSRPSLEERGIPPSTRRPGVEDRPPAFGPRRSSSPARRLDTGNAPLRRRELDKAARRDALSVPVRLVSQQQPASSDQNSSNKSAPPPRPAPAQSGAAPGKPATAEAGKPPADIIVTIRPNGIVISSEDLDALDDYEDLVRSLMSGETLPPQPTIFYLKNAKATEAAALLGQILGVEQGGSSGGSFGRVIGGVASNLVGGIGGDLIGGLLGATGDDSGASGTLQTTGAVSITPDARLNALIVQANATDLDLIDQLVHVIDQDSPPQDPDTAGKTYIIPVVYTSAAEMAEVVKQAFPENILGAESSSQRRPPSPQEFLQALAGRRGRGGRGGREPTVQERKMAIGVDERSNSLIITGPEHLYKKVLQLVQQLDREELNASETVSVITLPGGTNAEMLKNHLTSILGESMTTGTTRGTSTGRGAGPSGGPPQGGQPDFGAIRRRIEFFRSLQRMRGGGGPPGGFRPGGGGRPSGGFRPEAGGGRSRGGPSPRRR